MIGFDVGDQPGRQVDRGLEVELQRGGVDLYVRMQSSVQTLCE